MHAHIHTYTHKLNSVPKTLFYSAKTGIKLCCKSHYAENINEFGLKNSRLLDIKQWIPEEASFNSLTLRGLLQWYLEQWNTSLLKDL